MTLRISQTLDMANQHATLRLEGAMGAEQASLLQRHCDDLTAQSVGSITLDLAELRFLDEESGAAIRRLRETRGVRLIGCCLFTQEVIDGGVNV